MKQSKMLKAKKCHCNTDLYLKHQYPWYFKFVPARDILPKKRWSLTFASPYRTFRYTEEGRASLELSTLEAVPRTWFDFESDVLVFMAGASTATDNHLIEQFCRDIELTTRKLIRNVCVNFDGNEPHLINLMTPEHLDCENVHNGFPGLRNILVSFRREPTGDHWIVCILIP